MFKRLLLSALTVASTLLVAKAQTTVIGQTTNNGGFESATAAPWVLVNGTQTNKWVIDGGATTGFSGTKAAYISNGAAPTYSHTYDNNSISTTYLYQDVTLPAGSPVLNLSFKAIQKGESGWDQMMVYISTNTPGAAPTAGTPIPGYFNTTPVSLAGYQPLGMIPVQSTAAWTTYSYNISRALAGNGQNASTRRILFMWVNDGSAGVNPPIGLDSVTLTAECGIAVTASPLVTSATLNWNTIAGATQYQVKYRLASQPVTVATWATPTSVTTNNISLSGLTANSTYLYEVAPVGASSCPKGTDTGRFNTLCTIATLPYTQDFETITANNTLPTCMTGVILGSNVLSYIANQSTYNRTNHTTGGSKFASFYYYPYGDKYIYAPAINLDSGKTYQMSFWYISDGYQFGNYDKINSVLSTTSDASGILSRGPAITTPSNTSYQQYVSNFTPNRSGIYYFGIEASNANFVYYLTVDDINIVELLPCAGTPTVTATGPSSICPNVAFTLNAAGYTPASGLTFQWQSSPSCTNPTWTNIAGATGSSYTVSAGIQNTTAYRVVLACTPTGQTASSNCVNVSVNSFFTCYCNSGATSTGDEDIGQVTVGTFANPATPPASNVTSSPGATYTDYRSLAPVQLAKGANVPVTVTQTTVGGFYGTYLKVFVDYNHNGLLTDAGETVLSIPYTGTSTAAPGPHFSGNFTIPATAQVGITLMRFVLVETSSASSVNPCGVNYTWGETEDYLMEISGKPVAPTVTNNGPVCGGDSVTITATTPAIITTSTANAPTYTLTNTNTTNSTGIFRVPTPITGTSAVFNVIVRAYNTNSDTGKTTVTIYPNPTIALDTIKNPTTCSGSDGSIQISNLGANLTYNMDYKRNGTRVPLFSITSNSTGRYTITGLNVATYDSIRLVSTFGCRSNILGPVALVPPAAPPTPYATYNQPLCLDGTLTAQIQNPNTSGVYNWYGPNGYTATGTTATRANLTYADTGLYSVTINVGGCISAPYNFRIYITPPSPAPTVSTQYYCQNTPSYPLVAQGVNLMWYTTLTGGTSSPSISPNTNTPGSAADTQRYYVTQNTNGCPSRPRTQVLAIIRPQPLRPTAPSTSLIYCQYEVVPALIANGSNVKFYTTLTGGVGTTTLTPSTIQPGRYTYYATQTISGCESERLAIEVLVKPKPAPPIVSSPVNLCQYAPPMALTAAGQNLLWYDVDTGGTGLPDAPLPYTGYLDTMDYYVTQTLDGCESDRANIHVVVNYTPNATFVPSKQFVCVDDTISFIYYGNALPDAEYNWFIPSSAGTEVSGQGSQGPFVARFNQVGTYQVRLIVNNHGCISSPVYQSFEVRSRPVVRINGKREVCIGEVTELTLDSLAPNITNYNWNFGDGTVVYSTQNTGPYGVKYETPGIKYVVVNTISRECGSYDLREEISVHAVPNAIILNKPTNAVCAGDSIRLQASDRGPGKSYLWSPASAFRSYERTGTTVYAIASSEGGATNITLTVTDSIGCKGEDQVSIQTQPCCNVFFPNAFTPNNDGKNDRFVMVTDGTPQISAFRVFNRWGKVMFETANSLTGWDGTYNGEAQQTGTYYYYTKYRCANGREYEQKGEVTLLR